MIIKRDWKVLLVDDDPDDHLLIRDIAKEIGCDLEWADRFDAALERITGQPWDVCLIDYRLGHRNGLELIRECLARGCQAPLIVLTGQGDLLIDVQAMEAGAVDYLEKGRIDAAILERSIRYAMDRKHAEAVLANRARELAYSNATIREFADVAGHELQAPLGTISEVLDHLQNRCHDSLDAGSEALLARAITATTRMKELISDLTTLAKAAADEEDVQLP